MGFGDDDDILQDFLVEAGEILEQLSEQLVELENSPDDKDLLNAIFRGFHTVKGGAGFLQLDAMVECCHVTENLFDILRNGQREVTPDLMDVVLSALDSVNAQYQEVQDSQPPSPADPMLISSLEALVRGESISGESNNEEASGVNEAEKVEQHVDAPSDSDNFTESEYNEMLDAISDSEEGKDSSEVSSNSDEITEDEFESLLDDIHGKGSGPSTLGSDNGQTETNVQSTNIENSDAGSDEITEDEFEALLDQLHGEGKAPNKNADEAQSQPAKPAPDESSSSSSSDLITEEEFDSLLDELHGKGKSPASKSEQKSSAKSSVSSESSAKTQKPSPSTTTPATKPKATPVAKSPTAKSPAAKGKEGGAGSTETTVRVDTQRLDDIMNMVGELVLVRNRLVRLGVKSTDEALAKAVANLDVVTADLQTSVMKTRMQPIKKVFGRFPRVVRDLARSLKKEINLELQGEDTDLDKNLVEALADPLVHLVRNAVDHGIESPADREAAGKSRVGKVVLSAEQEGDHILLSITDDGAGMDAIKLRQLAVDRGLYDEDAAARLTDQEAFELIFAPGFSTKVEISDVSGRGVGMDVVKTKITQLNGSIEISSKVGEGTRLTIKVPLTLAIMPTLMIMLDEQTFALPLVSVNEIFHMDLSKANIVDGQQCLTIRNKAIPIFHLKKWLVHKYETQPAPETAHVVIVSVGTQRVGFVVDQLIGQEEVVIKPLGKMLHGTPGMAGATITGDGTIALILDVPSMLKRYANAG